MDTICCGSVIVDGTPLPSASIIDGIGINTIIPNQTVTIIFQVQIVSNPPTFTPELQNLAFVNFQYNVGNALQAQLGNVETNVFVTAIHSAILSAVKLLVQPLRILETQSLIQF